jgi:hypothetical protein
MPLPSPSSSSSDLIPDNAFGNIDQLTASTEDSAGDQVRARAREERIPDEAAYHRRSQPRRDNKNQWEGSRFFSGRKRSSGLNPSNPSGDRRLRRSTGYQSHGPYFDLRRAPMALSEREKTLYL